MQELLLDIFQFCSNHSISIEIEWICRESNTEADTISNFIDIYDWGISFELLCLLQNRWGKLDVDWSASSYYNAKLPVFFSRFWNEGSTGMDAFTENWGEVFGLFVPPVILVPRVLQQIQEQRTRGVLVIPFWPSGFLAFFYAWARRDLPSKLQNKLICPFPKNFIRPQRVVGVFWYRRPLFSYVGIESELLRFMNASCVRVTYFCLCR